MTIKYKIYSHFDFDGAIAALLLKAKLIDHMSKNFPSELDALQVQIKPVDHSMYRNAGSVAGWAITPVSGPCAVLDFSLHPLLLSEKFYDGIDVKARNLGIQSYWIDHHETGAGFSFLTPENMQSFVPSRLTAIWDPSSFSTPGLMRTYRHVLQLPEEIILRFEKLIDFCEVVDGARFYAASDAADLSNVAVQLQALFCSRHPLIHREKLYCTLVDHLLEIDDGNFNKFLNFDPLYGVVLEYENKQHNLRRISYDSVTVMAGKSVQVAIADFRQKKKLWQGLGRFIPFELFPECDFAVHISPANSQGDCSITCGRNPWKMSNALTLSMQNVQTLQLGWLFSRMFCGGGHSCVAGGIIREHETKLLDDLVNSLCGTP